MSDLRFLGCRGAVSETLGRGASITDTDSSSELIGGRVCFFPKKYSAQWGAQNPLSGLHATVVVAHQLTRPIADMAASDIPPNQTLYVHNLNEKLSKEGLAAAIALLNFTSSLPSQSSSARSMACSHSLALLSISLQLRARRYVASRSSSIA